MKVIKEIEVVENILRLLKECLAISQQQRSLDEVKRIRSDIKLCKLELKKLMDHAENTLGETEPCSDTVKQNNVFCKM